MLSDEDHETLSQVAAGTWMGDLLRRYWAPACLSSELPEPGGAPLRVRLMAEDLVAFRDRNGKVGLVEEHCPHRGASLYFGRNEVGDECGLRCVYHGWQFDTTGACIDMPNEPRPFADRVRAKAYPTQEHRGIVWTYMGPPETIIPFPDFGHEGPAETEVPPTKVKQECNWIVTMEGALDTAHISHLHQFFATADFPDDGTDRPGYPSKNMAWKIWWHDRSPRIEVDDTWFGFRYAGLRQTPNGHTHTRVTSWVAPGTTIVGFVPYTVNAQFSVPIDEGSCWRYALATQPVVSPDYVPSGNVFEANPYRPPRNISALSASADGPSEAPPTGIIERDFNADNDYQIDRQVQRTTTFTGVYDFASQDSMVTESMGRIYDRTREHLGTTDVALSRMRTVLLNAARALAATGAAPPGLTGNGDFSEIRGAEKILAPGENWRQLGTREDQCVQDVEGLLTSD